MWFGWLILATCLFKQTQLQIFIVGQGEKGNLSQGEIKIRILGYLYNRGETGANGYTIEHRANIRSQEFNRFRGFLEGLCSLSLLTKYEVEIGRDKTRVNYKITQKVRTMSKLHNRNCKTNTQQRGTNFKANEIVRLPDKLWVR